MSAHYDEPAPGSIGDTVSILLDRIMDLDLDRYEELFAGELTSAIIAALDGTHTDGAYDMAELIADLETEHANLLAAAERQTRYTFANEA